MWSETIRLLIKSPTCRPRIRCSRGTKCLWILWKEARTSRFRWKIESREACRMYLPGATKIFFQGIPKQSKLKWAAHYCTVLGMHLPFLRIETSETCEWLRAIFRVPTMIIKMTKVSHLQNTVTTTISFDGTSTSPSWRWNNLDCYTNQLMTRIQLCVSHRMEFNRNVSFWLLGVILCNRNHVLEIVYVLW